MPNWTYQAAVERRVRQLREARDSHRLISVRGDGWQHCACGVEGEPWMLRQHFEVLDQEMALPPGVALRS